MQERDNPGLHVLHGLHGLPAQELAPFCLLFCMHWASYMWWYRNDVTGLCPQDYSSEEVVLATDAAPSGKTGAPCKAAMCPSAAPRPPVPSGLTSRGNGTRPDPHFEPDDPDGAEGWASAQSSGDSDTPAEPGGW